MNKKANYMDFDVIQNGTSWHWIVLWNGKEKKRSSPFKTKKEASDDLDIYCRDTLNKPTYLFPRTFQGWLLLVTVWILFGLFLGWFFS